MNGENAKAYPPEVEAYRQLKTQIDYGAEFMWKDVLQWMGLPPTAAEAPRGWDFNDPWMKLSKMLESDGYLVTERGMNAKGFRVMQRLEMADYIKSNQYRAANKSLEASLCLSRVPREGLEKHEVKKLDHWEEKTALIGATGKVLLRKKNLPSPEMVVKSIKQVK